MGFNNNMILSILIVFPPLTKRAFLYYVCNVKQQLYAKKISLVKAGEASFPKVFNL